MHSIQCITYVNKYSAGKSSLRDLQIGIEHGVVGCGSKRLDKSQQGDIVIINATDNKIKYAVIGQLIEKIASCDKWSKEGGHTWPYNWEYTPLTPIFEYNSETKQEITQICKDHSIYPGHVFNSRYCNKKYKPVVYFLLEKFSLLN
jgi:hypothetical protein